MNLMAYSSWLIFLFATSSNAFSEPEQIDDNQVEENLFGALKEIRSDIIRQLNEVKTSVDTISVEINELRSNQNSVSSKLENVISRIKEIEEISNDTRNEIEFCRENMTDLVLKKISSQSENEKEISSNEGRGNTCTEFTKAYLSAINTLFHTNQSQHQDTVSNINNCWKDLPKTMEGHTYFVTPKMNWYEAVSYCKSHGAKPFVPKTQDEFLAFVALTVVPAFFTFTWYPVNDIEEEGHLVLYDGTDYEKASYKLQKWKRKCPTCVDLLWPNNVDRNCVVISILGEALWAECKSNYFGFLCQGN